MATEEEIAREVYKGDERVIEIAKARFKRCKEREGTAQTRWIADMKFAHGDPDNGWQWPGYLWSQRKDDGEGYKPRLTVNKIRQHNLQITNDAKQNKPGIHIRPVGEDATFKAAKVWEGLVRHIERVSKATQAYGQASDHQVNGGIGYLRVVTDYIDGTFEQELFIKGVRNPLNCFLDPDHQEIDGSDSEFGFFFEDQPRVEFLEEYPWMLGRVTSSTLSLEPDWLSAQHVKKVEYYTKSRKKDRLVELQIPEEDRWGTGGAAGEKIIATWSKIPAPIRAMIDKADIIRSRPFESERVLWYKIACDVVLERGEWPGKFIPIVPVIGEEVIIENQLDRKGHTRNLKDAQRMYNYWTSNAVEQVALQTKAKWFVPVGASENLETYYRTINKKNYPFIPWNAFDEEGNQLPAPVPIDPPTMAEGYIKGMLVAQQELMMASGQREENFGQPTNAISGRAIAERQRQGDNATYHFIDGLAIAIRQVGNIILDTAPKIYTSSQVKMILAEDGSEQLIRVDPAADVAYAESTEDEQTWVIFNPKVGRFWVDSDVGPSYATKRQEAWDAFVQITTANQQLVTVIGDLMFRNADFPGADEIAERLKRMVPPEVLGEGPEPALVAAQAQNQQLQSLLAEMTEKLATQELALKDKAGEREIKSYDSETKRLKETGNAMADIGPEMLAPIVEMLVRQILTEGRPGEEALGEEEAEGIPVPGEEESAAGEAAVPATAGQNGGGEAGAPILGARKGRDGMWYVPDAGRPGKHMRVEPE